MEGFHIQHQLEEIAGKEHVRLAEPMKQHTTFRIGGCAQYFIMPDSAEVIQKLVKFCRENEIPCFIMGNGSNLLVSDTGYEGVVIQLYKNFSRVKTDGTRLYAQAGALLSRVAVCALEHSLKGFEFAAGIPGTIGGAVVMNAGAYDGEMKQVVEQVTALNEQGEIVVLGKDELELGYRTSVLQSRSYIALEIVIELEHGEQEQIRTRMEELKERRTAKQPLEYPSAGSTFKRPEGNYAGKLIMESGFRGYQVGGARVSDKHCGFVINTGDATARDVIELTRHIQDKVQKDSGVMLELEIRKLGDFS
ncbi:MAG: UDP-N-acetylmuramate dehydrogenase [Lachnospiraceae bacterium]|nr:UDP-N-acetylmuramate dehydrogenase [Lachnospiraceae bacterium]